MEINIDLTGGFGPNVLGNKPKPIEDALSFQIKKVGIMGFLEVDRPT